MTKIWLLVLCLISSTILAQAQTLTADAASGKKLAKELSACGSFFTLVSMCFEDKDLTSALDPQDKKHAERLAHAYREQAVKALESANNLAKLTDMPQDDLLSFGSNSMKGWMAEIDGNCRKIAILADKHLSTCKRLVEHQALRLKEISECTNKDKEGC